MKKIIVTLIVSIFLILPACNTQQKTNEEKLNLIPEGKISYTHFEIGNVIQDGKQAVFFNFSSDYTVNKIEIAGNLLDINGNTIYIFDTKMTFGTPTKNPEPSTRIEKDLIKQITSVSFTKITAYTAEEVNLNIN